MNVFVFELGFMILKGVAGKFDLLLDSSHLQLQFGFSSKRFLQMSASSCVLNVKCDLFCRKVHHSLVLLVFFACAKLFSPAPSKIGFLAKTEEEK